MSPNPPKRPKLSGSEIEDASNLTRGQFLIWTGQQISPDLPMYNMGWRFRLHLEVDPDRFTKAFAALVANTDVLRTICAVEDDIPQAVVSAHPAGQHETLTLSDSERKNLIEKMTKTRFDLGVETFRSALFHVSDATWEWVFVQHHILTDAASGEILLRRLGYIYQGLSDTAASEPVAVPQFQDWVASDGKSINTSDRAFWSEKVEALPAPTPLYLQENAVNSAQTCLAELPLGSERMSRLQAMMKQERFAAITSHQTQFNLLATAIFAWLHRITGGETVAVGTTHHGRTTMVARQTAGLFMETLPLSADFDSGTTFESLHAQVSENVFDLMMHASPGVSSVASHAGFNVVLNYIRAEFGEFSGAPVSVDWLDHGHFDPAHAMWIDVVGFGGTNDLTLRLRMNEGVFSEGLQSRAKEQILRCLDAMLVNPQTLLDHVALATEDDNSLVLTQQDPALSAVSPEDVCRTIERLCVEAPEQLVLEDDAERLTRAQLRSRSDAIARILQNRGIGAGDRVGVFLTRGCNLVAAMLAVLKCGAAYVPLDPLQPVARLMAIADAADLSLTVTEERLANRWVDAQTRILVEDIDQDVAATVALQIDPSADAYVIFTSGSTGTPKGVCISRASLARYATFAAQCYAGGAPMTWALHSAIGFDLTVTSIFAPLVSGGVIRAYREALGAADLSVLKVFQDATVDIVKLTPAHLSLVVQEDVNPGRIKTLILGGEDLTTSIASTALEKLGRDAKIFNEYGPTEATVGCMVHLFDPDKDTGKSVPIGRPAEATAIYVLDEALNPVPDCVQGEIYVSGPERLARGYLNRGEETHQKFIVNPFLPQERMYRTGDLAHVDTNGVIHYDGRADDQIKIGSVRVELGEIKNAVLSHPAVMDCIVSFEEGSADPLEFCIKCGLGNDHPDAEIDDGVCRLCQDFDAYREKAALYFRSMDDLKAIVEKVRTRTTADYDCIVLLSGGKDSTYALGQMIELTPRILAVTLDNGFLSKEAMANIERVCKSLGVNHRFISTPFMNEIFADSLDRHANVCNGCFKTIYTLGMQLAQKEGIGLIVTGLSRGQLFETRLAPELFGKDGVSPEQIDRNILEARRSYHQVPDAATRRLNGRFFDNDTVFDQVQFVDFYRYCDASLEDIYTYLDRKVPWFRPSDTGRSSNCLINDLGIFVHTRRRGYHNYALPYSWDVRTGHKTRSESLDELDDEINEARMREIMQQIGYTPKPREEAAKKGLSCYVVGTSGANPNDLRRHLATMLPQNMIPPKIVPVPRIPLTPNGKVDLVALRSAFVQRQQDDPFEVRAPANDIEAQLLEIWKTVLDREDFGTDDNFFHLGGDSVLAISIASRASRIGLKVSALSILTHQTVLAVASELGAPKSDHAKAKPKRATLDSKSVERLGALFGKKRDG